MLEPLVEVVPQGDLVEILAARQAEGFILRSCSLYTPERNTVIAGLGEFNLDPAQRPERPPISISEIRYYVRWLKPMLEERVPSAETPPVD